MIIKVSHGTDMDRLANSDQGYNVDRSRWYGLRLGDIVEEKAFGMSRKGVVQELHPIDNNCCTIVVSGKHTNAVCAWCTIIEKVEDR